jgi:hypothetical protein
MDQSEFTFHSMSARPDFPGWGKSLICLSSPVCKNIFISFRPKSPAYSTYPVPQEGRFAIVTDVGRDAVDADALLTNSAEADGEVVWSWRLDAGAKPGGSFPRGDGGKKADHRGEHEGNR